MTTPDFYNSVLAHAKTMKYGDKINLRNIFKNSTGELTCSNT